MSSSSRRRVNEGHCELLHSRANTLQTQQREARRDLFALATSVEEDLIASTHTHTHTEGKETDINRKRGGGKRQGCNKG